MSNHKHSTKPGRCCEEEAPEAVLQKLHRNKPTRAAKHIPLTDRMQGESEEDYQQRLEAWEDAVAREETRRRHS